MFQTFVVISLFFFSLNQTSFAATRIEDLAEQFLALTMHDEKEEQDAQAQLTFQRALIVQQEAALNKTMATFFHNTLHSAQGNSDFSCQFEGLKIAGMKKNNHPSSEKIMIQANNFPGTTSLAWLQLIGNDCPPRKQRLHKGLTHVQIRGCSLKILAKEWFAGFNNLRFVDVADNKIHDIEPEIFTEHVKLRGFWVFNNDPELEIPNLTADQQKIMYMNKLDEDEKLDSKLKFIVPHDLMVLY